MTSVEKFWKLVEWAQESGVFFYRPNELYVRSDLKENSKDKVLWIPAFWQGLFPDSWQAMAHQALDIRLDGGDVIDFIYQAKLGAKYAQTEDAADEPASDGAG